MIARVELENMTLDLLVWKVHGRRNPLLVERALALNPGVAAGVYLPVGALITLPDHEAATPPTRETVALWS